MLWLIYISHDARCMYFSITEENEERSMIEPNSRDEPKVKELMKVFLFHRTLSIIHCHLRLISLVFEQFRPFTVSVRCYISLEPIFKHFWMNFKFLWYGPGISFEI